MRKNPWLILAGVLSSAAALLHVAAIFGGADWYRAMGAGEGMARAAERGSATPSIVTAAIAVVLFIWSLYALSGAGFIRRLPLIRTALVLISVIYLVRALAPVPTFFLRPDLINAFTIWSSLIVFVFGLAYALGTWTAWPELSLKPAYK